MIIILGASAEDIRDYMSGQVLGGYIPVYDSARMVEGSRPREVHLTERFFENPNWEQLYDVVERSARKMPPTERTRWFVGGSEMPEVIVAAVTRMHHAPRGAVAEPPEVSGPLEIAVGDANRARELVKEALDYNSSLRRQHSSERLLAAAQVYATLATRA